MTRTAFCALIALGACGLVTAQAPTSPFVQLVSIGDYPGETYTEGPVAPAEYVFFEGEIVAVDVRIANWSSAVAALDLTRGARPVVRVEGLDPHGPATVEAARTDGVWRDGIEGTERAQAASVMTIAPGDAMRWRLLLEDGLSPGLYRVRGFVDAVDARGERVRAHRPEVVVEVRQKTAGLPAEHARRVAEWLAATGDVRAARAATDALRAVYPDSVVVHLIRSRLAEAEGDAVLARQELDVAATFMRSDRDTLFRRFARPGQIEDLIDSLGPSLP